MRRNVSARLSVVLLAAINLNSCGIRSTALVAAYGDSVTWGYGGLPGGWVDILSQRSGVEISNLGNPGEDAQGGAKRIDAALATVPGAKVVTIYHGGNDWVGIFRGEGCVKTCTPESKDSRYLDVGMNLRKMRDRVAAFDKRPVFVTYWPNSPEACEVYDASAFTLYQAHRMRLNSEIEAVAAEHGDAVVHLDQVAPLGTEPRNWHDCLHPSRQGYEVAVEQWMIEQDHWRP